MDALLNPYLAITALAEAGMLGLETQTVLPPPVHQSTTDPVSCCTQDLFK